MNGTKKTVISAVILFLIGIGAGYLAVRSMAPAREPLILSGVAVQEVFKASDFTNTSATVGVLTTQVLPANWSNYARISRTSNTVGVISCAASSSAVANTGLILFPATSTTIGQTYLEFGYCPTCIPLRGIVNCLSSATTTVGIFYR